MKKGIAVAVASIASLAIGIGGTYYYMSSTYEKNLKNQTTKESSNKTTSSIKNLDIYSNIVQNNLTKYFKSIDCQDHSELYLNNKKVLAKDIPNLTAYQMVAMSTYENKNNISETDWNKEIEKIFGKDYKYNPTSFDAKDLCTSHIYNSDTKQYDYRETACGCTTGPNAFTLIYATKAEINNDILTIYLKALFPGREISTKGEYPKYYSDQARTKEVELDFITDINGKEYSEPIYSAANVQKGGSYKITMKKYNDNDYYFVSSEPVQ